jgi:hypothetical protein
MPSTHRCAVVPVHGFDIPDCLGVQVFFELVALVQVMKFFYALLQTDRDEQPGGNSAQMDPEVFPGMEGMMRCVNVHLGAPVFEGLGD